MPARLHRLAQILQRTYQRIAGCILPIPNDRDSAQHRQRLQAARPQALALVRQHQQAGDTVLIITATNEFVTRPIARLLGVQELLAVELERDASGWFTGAIRGVPSMREGKVLRMEQWLLARGLAWSTVHSTFYSDSMNDLPLLECVNAPVATNPDARLRTLATQRGWRILDLFPQG